MSGSRRGSQRQPSPQPYTPVPLQSPRQPTNPQVYASRVPVRAPSSSQEHARQAGRNAMAMGVASGAIGGGYGPYSVSLLRVA